MGPGGVPVNHDDLHDLLDGTQPCRHNDPDLWFPREHEVSTEARTICAGCQFRQPCLTYALAHREEGIWGGTSEPQRAYIRKQLRIIPTAPRPGKPGVVRRKTGAAA